VGQRKLAIIQNFDLSYSIIEIDNKEWHIVAGPYLTKEEAEVDLRNIICEQE
jgi:hypothetical protein